MEPGAQDVARVFTRDNPQPPPLQPFRPSEEDLRVAPSVKFAQRTGPSGLRRALTAILPIARDLAAATAAGANQPTVIGGLGAGLAQEERQRQQREQRQERRETLAQKAAHDWQKLQMDWEKAQADIEKSRAEAGKARQETTLLEPAQRSRAELQTAQAKAATDAAELSRARAAFERDRLAQGIPKAQAEAEAARTVNFNWLAKRNQEYVDSGLDRATAKLRASQDLKAAQDIEESKARVAAMPLENARKQLNADASLMNAKAALGRVDLLRQQGQIRPADVLREQRDYDAARSRLVLALSRAVDDDVKAFVQNELATLEAAHKERVQDFKRMQQAAPAPGGGGVSGPLAAPKIGDTQTYQGATYVFDGQQWVRQ